MGKSKNVSVCPFALNTFSTTPLTHKLSGYVKRATFYVTF
jgi:hypothetical protein